MRVFVAGMGSAVGTSVAMRLERDAAVTAIAGVDLEPPRRYLPNADFRFAEPGDAARVHEIVERFRPDVVVHCWVFEPRSRSTPGQARGRTVAGTEALFGALAKLDTVRRIIVRSGVSIYGTGRGTPARPTVDAAARPTSTFGSILANLEARTDEVGQAVGADVVHVRLAPVMASNLPNPLGRLLRLPVVPVPITTNRFGVVHLGDAARVMAACVTADTDTSTPAADTSTNTSTPADNNADNGGDDTYTAADRASIPRALNVMADDPVTPLEAITVGRRVPLPMAPPLFRATRLLGELPGTPIPEHVAELLARGQVVTPSDVERLLGRPLRRTTRAALRDLYATGKVIDVDRSRLMPKAG